MDKQKGKTLKQFKSEIKDEKGFNSKKQLVAQNLKGMNRGPIAEIWDTVQGLWKYVSSNEVPWIKKVAPLAALVYLISPIDAVPDFIPIVGLLDDVGVITACVASIGSVLNKYRKQ
jgi:uncharacterized membrane protein YkvA (DUF1232 family)